MINFAAAVEPETAIVPYDLSPIKTRLMEYDIAIDQMVGFATSLDVTNDSANVRAVEMAGQSKKLWKRIEDVRKAAVREPNEFIKSVNALAKSYQDRLTMIENGLKRKISDYQARVELERRKQQENERQEREKLQAKVNAEAAALNVEAPVIAPAVAPEVPKVTRTEVATASQRLVWKFEITDIDAVPKNYKIVDERKVREAIKAGIRDIPGIKIFPENTTIIRN